MCLQGGLCAKGLGVARGGRQRVTLREGPRNIPHMGKSQLSTVGFPVGCLDEDLGWPCEPGFAWPSCLIKGLALTGVSGVPIPREPATISFIYLFRWVGGRQSEVPRFYHSWSSWPAFFHAVLIRFHAHCLGLRSVLSPGKGKKGGCTARFHWSIRSR